jgi:hypothetical protein
MLRQSNQHRGPNFVEKIFDSWNINSIFTIVNLFLTVKFKKTWQQRKKLQRKKQLLKRKQLRRKSKLRSQIKIPRNCGGFFFARSGITELEH